MGKIRYKFVAGDQMNSKPLCIASMLVCFMTACLAEGNVLTFGQAIIVMLVAGVLSIWNGAQKEKDPCSTIIEQGSKKRKQKNSI